ncbi:MAG: hypothetical protein IPL28_10970 [Chloroflexi bacterium]|nr:hypothetical protein [Chloroflexota bacterium]
MIGGCRFSPALLLSLSPAPLLPTASADSPTAAWPSPKVPPAPYLAAEYVGSEPHFAGHIG